MVKHSFELKQYSNCFKLSIIGHEKPGTLDWRQVVSMTPDELDDLRRLLGVGMGDCDHCPAWSLYEKRSITESGEDREAAIKAKENRQNVISYDMKRLESVEARLDYIQGEGGLKPMTIKDIYWTLRKVLERVESLEKYREAYEADTRGEEWRKELDEHDQHFARHDAIMDVMQKNNHDTLIKYEKLGDNIDRVDGQLNTIVGALGNRVDALELSRLAHANRLSGVDKSITEFEQGSKYANDKFDCIDALITKVENRINDVARNATHHIKRIDTEFDQLDKYLRGTQPCEFAKGVSEEQDIHSQHLTKLDAVVSTMQSDLEILKLALVTINESNRKDAPDKPGSRGSKKN